MKNKATSELQQELIYAPESAWDQYDQKKQVRVFKLSEEYKGFLDAGKTERECVKSAVQLLTKAGFKSLDQVSGLLPGDKIYATIENKGLVAAVLGEEPVTAGMHILGAHIDSPRLDLKPVPLYEDADMALFKTHYYGGIKKYQWSTVPLALHGAIMNRQGEKIEVAIGEAEEDPIFTINELLVHLSQEQLARKASEAVKGEELNVLAGGLPFEDKDAKSRVKLNILRLLKETYGITERDLITAELELVPAHKARDVGFDRAFIGAYGQDDRVCAFAALKALTKVKKPVYTSVCLLTDKEEIGSVGNTGACSRRYENVIMEMIIKAQGQCGIWDLNKCIENSGMLSADVTSAFDPTYAGAFDKQNTAYAGKGVCLLKYSGSRGKGGANDAHCEFFSSVVGIFDARKVPWQTGELGRVDLGGGGTIAADMANMGMRVIDCGVPVLSMHAPLEVTSKADIYATYQGFLAYLENKE